jgi:general L-amino acid transport system substrate-binding protein
LPQWRAAFLAAGLLLVASAAHAGARLDAILARGHLVCGVGADVAGFSRKDANGAWHGFDTDLCRAMAATLFGDSTKVAFAPIDTVDTFLKSPDIDLVLRGLTWTYQREMRAVLRFGPIVMYDGETFLVPKRLGITSAAQLSGRPICVSADVEFVPILQRFFRRHALNLKMLVSDKRAQAEDAFFAGRCDAITADASELAEALIAKAPRPDDFAILQPQISKEPLAPLLRKGDDQFFDIVRWSIFALIDAEELGINAANAGRMRTSDDPDIKHFFAAPPPGTRGFVADWSYRAVTASGNYGEIYERNLGLGSPAKLAREMNRLWTQNGLMYAPPLR